MRDTNQLVITGRLSDDIQTNYGVGQIMLAVNTPKKTDTGFEDVVNFFEVVVGGKILNNLHNYLKKGKQVNVTGELRQDLWTDSNNRACSHVYILAHNIQLLGGMRYVSNQESE